MSDRNLFSKICTIGIKFFTGLQRANEWYVNRLNSERSLDKTSIKEAEIMTNKGYENTRMDSLVLSLFSDESRRSTSTAPSSAGSARSAPADVRKSARSTLPAGLEAAACTAPLTNPAASLPPSNATKATKIELNDSVCSARSVVVDNTACDTSPGDLCDMASPTNNSKTDSAVAAIAARSTLPGNLTDTACSDTTYMVTTGRTTMSTELSKILHSVLLEGQSDYTDSACSTPPVVLFGSTCSASPDSLAGITKCTAVYPFSFADNTDILVGAADCPADESSSALATPLPVTQKRVDVATWPGCAIPPAGPVHHSSPTEETPEQNWQFETGLGTEQSRPESQEMDTEHSDTGTQELASITLRWETNDIFCLLVNWFGEQIDFEY